MRPSKTLVSLFSAAAIAALGVAQAAAQPVCRPTLTLKEAQLSPMRTPTLERTWTAIVAVDASRCAANASGYFNVGFSRMKEIGPELDFEQEFAWLEPSVKIEVEFAADEAVEHTWFGTITPCPCKAGAQEAARR